MGLKVGRVLISVHDKRGLVEFARGLRDAGCEMLSSGGTFRFLEDNGITSVDIASYTGSPEIMGGRVKTLHPKIHAGILARRELDEDTLELRQIGAHPIDLVVVNLYPFENVSAEDPEDVPEVIENIDIGGPALLRSAAKNFQHVGVVVDPADYRTVLAEISDLSLATRLRLAGKAFERVEAYDRAIATYFTQLKCEEQSVRFQRPEGLAERLIVSLIRHSVLRYGENPHQRAALYAEDGVGIGWRKHQGKEISYNNWLDADSAWKLVSEFERTACAIIKHNNPCGTAEGETVSDAWRRALECDPVSAYGGIVAFNRTVTEDVAHLLSEVFLEVIVAPAYDVRALMVLEQKKSLRVITVPASFAPSRREIRSISVGVLVQDADLGLHERLAVVSERQPNEAQMADLIFASKVTKYVRSNAIVIAKDAQAIGIGAGQMSRVDAVRLAVFRSRKPTQGAVLASDGFFPFADGVEEAARSGIACVIHPGGSVRDKEVIEAANNLGLVMVLTGMRHFRH